MKTRIAKKIVYNTDKLRMWIAFGYCKKPKLKYSFSQIYKAAFVMYGSRKIAKLYAKKVSKKIQIQPWAKK